MGQAHCARLTARFRVTVVKHVCQEREGPASVHGNDSMRTLPPMRILIVEDDASLAYGVAQILRANGHTVEQTDRGDTALESAARQRFELLLLDIGLPGMDGYEVLRRLREAEDQIPVLVVTARGAVSERVHGLDLGADDYLAKPFAMDELSARVRALMRRANSQTAPQIAHGPLTVDKV